VKKLPLFLIGALACVMLSACQQGEQNASEPLDPGVEDNNSEEVKENNSEGEASDTGEASDEGKAATVITAKAVESYPISLYDQTEFDLDGDGEDEKIELHVNAAKAEDGEFAWDDGQDWLLVVKDGDVTYPLFDGWVQIGKLTFWLLESGEKPMLILLQTGTADFTLKEFTFNSEKNGYVSETIYRPEDVNFWYYSK
jgi:hypothetical protein